MTIFEAVSVLQPLPDESYMTLRAGFCRRFGAQRAAYAATASMYSILALAKTIEKSSASCASSVSEAES